MDGRDLCITRNFSGLDMSTPFGVSLIRTTSHSISQSALLRARCALPPLAGWGIRPPSCEELPHVLVQNPQGTCDAYNYNHKNVTDQRRTLPSY
jgi:hypothetical protein